MRIEIESCSNVELLRKEALRLRGLTEILAESFSSAAQTTDTTKPDTAHATTNFERIKAALFPDRT